jgi:hypothetical protein
LRRQRDKVVYADFHAIMEWLATLATQRAALAAVFGTNTETATEAVKEVHLAVERMDMYPNTDLLEEYR